MESNWHIPDFGFYVIFDFGFIPDLVHAFPNADNEGLNVELWLAKSLTCMKVAYNSSIVCEQNKQTYYNMYKYYGFLYFCGYQFSWIEEILHFRGNLISWFCISAYKTYNKFVIR